MDEIEQEAEELLRYLKLCPRNGVTEQDLVVSYLRRRHSAGKVEASDQLGGHIKDIVAKVL